MVAPRNNVAHTAAFRAPMSHEPKTNMMRRWVGHVDFQFLQLIKLR
jgi:hypothetical protein